MRCQSSLRAKRGPRRPSIRCAHKKNSTRISTAKPRQPKTTTMKIALALLVTASTASAFVPMSHKNAAVVRMSEEEVTTEAPVEETAPPARVGPVMSQSLPFMQVNAAVLDGSMPGDVGFDPLGFAKTKEDLFNYREAEVKHARLAMLAAAGWPLSELYDKKFANLLGLPAVLDNSDRAPSVLNGGLGKISPVYWALCLAGAAAIDLWGIKKASQEPGYFPGNYGFDPLGMYPKNEAAQKKMQLAEIKNGRLAMIAITAFAVQELVTQSGVVDATPLFFKPIDTVMREYANSGYYIPE
eukprot:scaffold15421_cov168-Amphora_coffeaeformis.AAC.2